MKVKIVKNQNGDLYLKVCKLGKFPKYIRVDLLVQPQELIYQTDYKKLAEEYLDEEKTK